MEYFNDAWVIAVLQVIAIDIVLGGDNAIIIALAYRNLQKHQRRAGIMRCCWGHYPAGDHGGFCYQLDGNSRATNDWRHLTDLDSELLTEVETHDFDSKIKQSNNLLTAIRTIIIADFAIVWITPWRSPLLQKVTSALLFGLLLSVPGIIWGRANFTVDGSVSGHHYRRGWPLGWLGGGLMISDKLLVELPLCYRLRP